MSDESNSIVNRALANLAEEMVKQVLVHHAGYGIETEVKKAILDRARELVKSPEIEKMIRDTMIHWIQRQ